MRLESLKLNHWKKGFWNRFLKYSCPFLSDERYLKIKFKHFVGYPLNFEKPITYNEKLQWLKLYGTRPEYTELVDKAKVKEYVAKIIGKDYIIPTYGIWDSVDSINWDDLPPKFVIKCTGDSGGVVICKDINTFNKKEAIKILKKAGKKSYYKYNKEYPYKNVHNRFIAEQYMEDESGFELKDYKFFCFNGEPHFLFVASGRQQNDTRFDFFDINYNHLPIINGHPNADICPSKPKCFDKMLDIARSLSKGIPHVRVDLYNVNGDIYFGELTFFHWSGMVPFEPLEWDYSFGKMIKLPIEI